MKYDVVPLSKIIKEWTIEDANRFLSGFACDRDRDLEVFLHKRAIVYEKRDLARTFLLVSEETIVGYFSLANTILEIGDDWPVSETLKRKMNVADGPAPAYLIGQLCKANGVDEKIGHEIINIAMSMINSMRKFGGGRVVCVDCKKELLEFYERNGFRVISRPSEDGLYRMVMLCS